MAKLVNCDSIAPDWQPGSLVMARSWPHRWDLQLALHVLRCEGADGARQEGDDGTGCASICYRFMLAAWPLVLVCPCSPHCHHA